MMQTGDFIDTVWTSKIDTASLRNQLLLLSKKDLSTKNNYGLLGILPQQDEQYPLMINLLAPSSENK